MMADGLADNHSAAKLVNHDVATVKAAKPRIDNHATAKAVLRYKTTLHNHTATECTATNNHAAGCLSTHSERQQQNKSQNKTDHKSPFKKLVHWNKPAQSQHLAKLLGF